MTNVGKGVAEDAYRHVIENAISGVENLPHHEAIDYLRNEWLPFALGCREEWQSSDVRAAAARTVRRHGEALRGLAEESA